MIYEFLFADDKTELFNPNCRNCLLLSNIKERCDCEDDGKYILYIRKRFQLMLANVVSFKLKKAH